MSLLFSPTNWANPGAIGSTTPSTGAFTTLQLTSGGPLFRNNAGTIEARNAANSALAPLAALTLNLTNTGALPLSITGSGGELFRINASSATDSRMEFRRQNTRIGLFGWDTGSFTFQSESGNNIIFRLIGSNDLIQFTENLTVRAAMSAAGNFSLFATTASTSTTTGALIVSGGAGIAGALNVGSTITSSQFRLSALNTAPSSASDTGVLGEVRIDANFIYVCTATNTWKRAAISTWS